MPTRNRIRGRDHQAGPAGTRAYENRGKRRGRRKYGEKHLLGPEHGSSPRPHALRPAPDDVLQHDDRIVDHKTRGQNNRQSVRILIEKPTM